MSDTVRLLLGELAAIRGRRVVSAAAPEAVAAGLAMLAQGGNAFDAAIAACLVEGVALPMKCGLGGDLVALVAEGDAPPRALLAIGAGVAALGHARLETVGPASVGVPGAPEGYAELARHGRLGLAALAAPAIAAAEEGVLWTRVGVRLTAESEALLRRYNETTPFLPEGRLPRIGERFRLPGFAALLRRFAETGGDLFRGEAGAILVRRLATLGGLVTEADLEQRPAAWHEAVSLSLPDATLWATPGPTHGPSLLRAVGLVRREGSDPVAAALQARQELRRAGSAAGDSGTSVVAAADDAGNTVVVVHSNSFPRYGSGVVVPEFDLVLNNRPGRGFAKDAPAGAANAPRPGRVPFTTLHAWAVDRDGARLLGATPGGINQMVWNSQTVVDCLDGKEPGAIVTAPRWALDEEDALVAEADHPFAAREGAKRVAPLEQRSVTQVIRRSAGAADVVAAADPRTGARVGAV